jgi:hypothetical protein
MAIDPKLPIPVYFQLKTLLLGEILDGRYGPDGRSLPSTSCASGTDQLDAGDPGTVGAGHRGGGHPVGLLVRSGDAT